MLEWSLNIFLILFYSFFFIFFLWAFGMMIWAFFGDIIADKLKLYESRKKWKINNE